MEIPKKDSQSKIFFAPGSREQVFYDILVSINEELEFITSSIKQKSSLPATSLPTTSPTQETHHSFSDMAQKSSDVIASVKTKKTR